MTDVHQSIKELRRDLEIVEDLYSLFNNKTRSQTVPESCGLDGNSTAMDFINWPHKYHHHWRNTIDTDSQFDFQIVSPWAFYLSSGHKFLHAIICGVQVEKDPIVSDLLKYHHFDLDRARFFFGKCHGPMMTEGNAFFAAVPVHTDLGPTRPFTPIFQISLYYAGTVVFLVADTVENLIEMKQMPWDAHWQDSDDHFPPLRGIILIDPAELNGPEGKGTKHPVIDLKVRHEFFDALRHYRFLQDLYGVPGLGSLRSAREHYPTFLGAVEP